MRNGWWKPIYKYNLDLKMTYENKWEWKANYKYKWDNFLDYDMKNHDIHENKNVCPEFNGEKMHEQHLIKPTRTHSKTIKFCASWIDRRKSLVEIKFYKTFSLLVWLAQLEKSLVLTDFFDTCATDWCADFACLTCEKWRPFWAWVKIGFGQVGACERV